MSANVKCVENIKDVPKTIGAVSGSRCDGFHARLILRTSGGHESGRRGVYSGVGKSNLLVLK